MSNDPTEIVRALVEADIRVLLYGPPGSGKTTIADTVLREFCGRVYHQTLTEETSPAEGIGHYIAKGGDFLWHDGPMVSAWREPGFGLVLNELDKASGPMHTALHCSFVFKVMSCRFITFAAVRWDSWLDPDAAPGRAQIRRWHGRAKLPPNLRSVQTD